MVQKWHQNHQDRGPWPSRLDARAILQRIPLSLEELYGCAASLVSPRAPARALAPCLIRRPRFTLLRLSAPTRSALRGPGASSLFLPRLGASLHACLLHCARRCLLRVGRMRCAALLCSRASARGRWCAAYMLTIVFFILASGHGRQGGNHGLTDLRLKWAVVLG